MPFGERPWTAEEEAQLNSLGFTRWDDNAPPFIKEMWLAPRGVPPNEQLYDEEGLPVPWFWDHKNGTWTGVDVRSMEDVI